MQRIQFTPCGPPGSGPHPLQPPCGIGVVTLPACAADRGPDTAPPVARPTQPPEGGAADVQRWQAALVGNNSGNRGIQRRRAMARAAPSRPRPTSATLDHWMRRAPLLPSTYPCMLVEGSELRLSSPCMAESEDAADAFPRVFCVSPPRLC